MATALQISSALPLHDDLPSIHTRTVSLRLWRTFVCHNHSPTPEQHSSTTSQNNIPLQLVPHCCAPFLGCHSPPQPSVALPSGSPRLRALSAHAQPTETSSTLGKVLHLVAPCHEDPASSKGLSRSCTLTRQSPRQSASVACSGIENCVHLNCGVWLPHPLSSNIHRDQKGHLHSKSKLICPFFPSPVPCSQIESGSSRLAMLSPAVNGEAGALHAELTDLDLHMHTQACQTRLSDMHDRSVQPVHKPRRCCWSCRARPTPPAPPVHTASTGTPAAVPSCNFQ